MGYVRFFYIGTSRKSYFQQIFLGYVDVKGSKTDTKSQVYCFIRFILMDTEMIKIDETPNLQRNSLISCLTSNVLNSIKIIVFQIIVFFIIGT